LSTKRKPNLKKAAKKAEKLLTRFKEKFPELIQNTTAKDWLEFVIMAGIAGIGVETFHDWRGGIYGLVSYRLATTEGHVSQTIGIAGLSAMGICGLFGDRINEAIKVMQGEPIYTDTIDPIRDPETGELTCPEGYKMISNKFVGAVACVRA
jgi:hypothetical protein